MSDRCEMIGKSQAASITSCDDELGLYETPDTLISDGHNDQGNLAQVRISGGNCLCILPGVEADC